jgi:hypothetical protein
MNATDGFLPGPAGPDLDISPARETYPSEEGRTGQPYPRTADADATVP